MALFIRQEENRTELQTRIAAELQEKARNKAREDELPDGVDDSAYIRDLRQSKKMGWPMSIVWMIIGLGMVGLVIWFITTLM